VSHKVTTRHVSLSPLQNPQTWRPAVATPQTSSLPSSGPISRPGWMLAIPPSTLASRRFPSLRRTSYVWSRCEGWLYYLCCAVCACMSECICMCVLHTLVCVPLFLDCRTKAHTHAHTHTHTHTHTHIHTHKQLTHTHTCTHSLLHKDTCTPNAGFMYSGEPGMLPQASYTVHTSASTCTYSLLHHSHT